MNPSDPVLRRMDIRTYLAGQAMNGIVSNARFTTPQTTYRVIAEQAIRCADSLIEELKNKKEENNG